MRHFLPDRVLSFVERSIGAHLTYAQYGEDLIVDRALRNLGIERPTYLDVGAYSPTLLSNTALFYRRGLSGVCVEADPELFAQLKRGRPRDVCINAGVGGAASDHMPFHVMSVRALSTFSRKTAEQLARSGECRLERVIEVPVMTLGDVIGKHFSRPPHFLSVDIEGGDLAALQTIDFTECRPEVVCAETLSYSGDPKNEVKRTDISDLMMSHNYFVFADTRVNTIFVDATKWGSRQT